MLLAKIGRLPGCLCVSNFNGRNGFARRFVNCRLVVDRRGGCSGLGAAIAADLCAGFGGGGIGWVDLGGVVAGVGGRERDVG